MSDSDDLKAVRESLEGDLRAFETLVLKYQKPIFNGAYRMLNHFEDAEDVSQAVFVKAFENLKKFDAKYRFFSWLYRILINESLNFMSKRRRQGEAVPDVLPGMNRGRRSQQAVELEKDIQEALMELKPDHRTIIVLKHFQDFSYEEMSHLLEIPEKTVKSRLYSARQELKETLVRKGFVDDDG